MGAGASSLNVDDVVAVANQPVGYTPPLGAPKPVRAMRALRFDGCVIDRSMLTMTTTDASSFERCIGHAEGVF